MNLISQKPKPFKLGRDSITLRTQEASYIPVISDLPYVTRTQAKAWLAYKGARPIHRTTLELDRSRHKLDYETLYKHIRMLQYHPDCEHAFKPLTNNPQYYHGNPRLNGVRRPPTCPSLFTSQWEIGENRKMNFKTNNNVMFPPKTGQSVAEMRNVQVGNRISNNHGMKMMCVTDHDTPPSYLTSYRVSHDALGSSRGRGVPHFRNKAPSFNIISGEESAPVSGRSNYRMTSGNRILSQQRKRPNIYQTFQLG